MKITPSFVSKLVFAPLLALSCSNAFAAAEDLSTWNSFGDATVSSTSAVLNSTDNTSTHSTASFLDEFGNPGTIGSELSKAFNLAAGSTISFKWDYSTSDFFPNNDFAAIYIGGVKNILSSVTSIPSSGDTGWQTFSYTFSSAFNGTISLVSSNGGDNFVNSSLAINNVDVTAVPEAEEWAMMVLGLPMIGMALRRKQKAMTA